MKIPELTQEERFHKLEVAFKGVREDAHRNSLRLDQNHVEHDTLFNEMNRLKEEINNFFHGAAKEVKTERELAVLSSGSTVNNQEEKCQSK